MLYVYGLMGFIAWFAAGCYVIAGVDPHRLPLSRIAAPLLITVFFPSFIAMAWLLGRVCKDDSSAWLLTDTEEGY